MRSGSVEAAANVERADALFLDSAFERVAPQEVETAACQDGDTGRTSACQVRGFVRPSGAIMRRLLTISLLFLLMTSSARAASLEDQAKAARRSCMSGDYVRGVEILSDLFLQTYSLTYVFNQGRCFEQNGRYSDAINRFHEYARKLKDSGHPADPDVERHIADCQAMIDKQSGVVAPRPQPAEQATPPVTQRASSVSATEAKATDSSLTSHDAQAPVGLAQTASDTNARPGLRVAGLVVTGIGLAGLATAVVLNLKANALADELDSSTSSYSRSKASTRSTYQSWGWVSYGVGAGCLIGGAVLYLVARSQGKSRQVTFSPEAGPGLAGVSMQGAF
jgi:hypothetical protein